MTFLTRLILAILPFAGTLLQGTETSVHIFGVGQGNGVLVRYGKQAVMIDLGSAEIKYHALYRKAEAIQKERLPKKFLEKLEDASAEDPSSASVTLTADALQSVPEKSPFNTENSDHKMDLSQSPSHESEGSRSDNSSSSLKKTPISTEEEDSETLTNACTNKNSPSSAERPNKKQKVQQEPIKKEYQETLLSSVWSQLPLDPEKAKIRCLKTLVVTHPDQDHYNLLPALFCEAPHEDFPEETWKIDSVLLGGWKMQYSEKFQDWLTQHTGGKIQSVRFLGTNQENGSVKDIIARTNGNYSIQSDYARSFHTGKYEEKDKTELENHVEKTLLFSADKAQEAPPFFQILAMNTGHAERTIAGQTVISPLNEDNNMNSFVLRLVVPQKNKQQQDLSFVFGADANAETWRQVGLNFMATQYGDLSTNKDFLKSTGMLISHHGSDHHDETNQYILDIFQPKCCFISAGRHRGFHHPRKTVCDLLLACGYLEKREAHLVSYFSSKKKGNKKKRLYHHQKTTKEALYNTLNHGHITLTFDEGEASIKPSEHTKRKQYQGVYKGPENQEKTLDFIKDLTDAWRLKPGTDPLAFLEGKIEGSTICLWEKDPQQQKWIPSDKTREKAQGQTLDALTSESFEHFFLYVSEEEEENRFYIAPVWALIPGTEEAENDNTPIDTDNLSSSVKTSETKTQALQTKTNLSMGAMKEE
eukprot:m.64213 g.64213  ORF g.64213 m.64213 type:complete len:702 (+) comp11631_c0_seq1:1603-3708(+)